MGWDFHHELAPFDRKAVCRRYVSKRYEVIKDAVVGTTWYAALRNKETGDVHAAVCLTRIDRNDYCNFGMKWLGEADGPLHYDCPESILRLLSPTDDKYSLEWREKCRTKREQVAAKNGILNSAPYGARLRVTLDNGEERVVTKEKPTGGKFKTFWLLCTDRYAYVPKQWVKSAAYADA